MENLYDWCFSWFVKQGIAPGKDRAALAVKYKWKSNDRITISFLDGDPALQDRVQAMAKTWTGPQLANLRLSFQKSNDSMIRISFAQPGSWSVIGTSCTLNKDLNDATMNFGALKPDSPQDKVQRQVLHEFGHALGMIHEHQSPGAEIEWNRPVVEADLKAGGWSQEDIQTNMWDAYSKAETNFTAFDSESIMLYPIPKKWTLNNYSVGWNLSLSKTDEKFIRKHYS